jgi:bacillithiol system protein YtxJ
MHPELTPISGIDELDVALRESRQRPLLLFKHSYSCGISAEALDELLSHLAEKDDDARYAMVTVQTHRDVSNAIASRLGIRHETPQALLVRDGQVVWSASHFRVNASAIKKALNGAPPDGRAPAPRPMRTTTPTEN